MGAAASVDADVVQRIDAVFAFIDTSNFQTIDRAELGAFFERSGENGFDCAVRARKWILENDVALDKRVSLVGSALHNAIKDLQSQKLR